MSNATISPPERPYLTPPEAAELLGVCAEKVCGFIRAGELRASNVATRVGGRPRWRIHRADLETFLAARANEPPARPAKRRAPAQGFTEYIPL